MSQSSRDDKLGDTPIVDALIAKCAEDYRGEPQEWTPELNKRHTDEVISLARQLEREIEVARENGYAAGRASTLTVPMSSTASMETETMQDAARGIIQILRGKPGCTEHDVFMHCKLRGDSTEGLHENDGTYVTEARALAMIWRAMQRAQSATTCGLLTAIEKAWTELTNGRIPKRRFIFLVDTAITQHFTREQFDIDCSRQEKP